MIKKKAVSLTAKGAKKLFPHLIEYNKKKHKYSKIVENADFKGKETLGARKKLAVRAAMTGLKINPEKRQATIKLGRSFIERYCMLKAWGKNERKDLILKELETDIYDFLGINTGAKFTAGLKFAYKDLVVEK